MRDNALNVRSHKQDYINATESVLKLLRIVKEHSPAKNIEMSLQNKCEGKESSLLGGNPARNYRRRDKKSLREGSLEGRRLAPYQSRVNIHDYADVETQPLFPHIDQRRFERFGTEPADTNICSTMNLVRKDDVDIRLETLRSNMNLHGLFTFEDSIARPPISSVRKYKKRVHTDCCSVRNFQPAQRRQIANLEKVLVVPEPRKSKARENSPKASQSNEKHIKNPMTMTRRLIEGAYSGWQFDATNNEWQFSVADAIKRRHR